MEFNDLELDALREILNIGSTHASTALSKMVGKKINVSFPWVKQVRIEKIPELVGNPEDIVATVYLQIDGEHDGKVIPLGGLMIILHKKDALELTNLLMQKKGTDLSEIDRDALKEVGNILSGTSLNILTKILKIRMVESIPDISVDMLNATFDSILANIGSKADESIVFKTEFEIEEHDIRGFLMFVFNPDATKLIHRNVREAINVNKIFSKDR